MRFSGFAGILLVLPMLGCSPCRDDLVPEGIELIDLFSNVRLPSRSTRVGSGVRFQTYAVTLDGRAAVATGDAWLLIGRLDEEAFEHELVLDTLAVAWANDGERLAVVTWNEGDAYPSRLRVFSDGVESLDLGPLALSTSNEEPALVISWSADDQLIAVSTDSMSIRGFECVPTGGMVIRVADGAAFPMNLINAHFVGPRELVGNAPDVDCVTHNGGSATVHRMAVDAEAGSISLVETTEIRGRPIADAAVLGLFATMEFVNRYPFNSAIRIWSGGECGQESLGVGGSYYGFVRESATAP